MPFPECRRCTIQRKKKGETLVITMTEKASDIVLKLFYGVFEKENVITRAARLENHGETAIELEKMLSFSMDLMYENYEMIYFSGRHAMERTAERIPVQHAKRDTRTPVVHRAIITIRL